MSVNTILGPEIPAWTLDAGWPVFAGHFPDHPVLPGALLLDWIISNIETVFEHNVEAVSQAKFPAAAEPGDCLTLSLDRNDARVRFEVVTMREGTRHTVASGQLKLCRARLSCAPLGSTV